MSKTAKVHILFRLQMPEYYKLQRAVKRTGGSRSKYLRDVIKCKLDSDLKGRLEGRNKTFSESMNKLHMNGKFDTKVIIVLGSPKEIQDLKNLNVGEFCTIVEGHLKPAHAEYIFQERGLLHE